MALINEFIAEKLSNYVVQAYLKTKKKKESLSLSWQTCSMEI